MTILPPFTMPSSKSAMLGVMIFLTVSILATWNKDSVYHVHGFQNAAPKPPPQDNVLAGTVTGRIPTILRDTGGNGNADDEIAQLEEQLRRLKEEKAAQQQSTTTSSSVPSQRLDSIMGGSSAEEVPIEMFLSEGWKEKEATQGESSGGGVLTTVLGAVALTIFLAVFAQVPIGQEDLSKYSAIRAPTEQIDLGDLNRARNSGRDI